MSIDEIVKEEGRRFYIQTLTSNGCRCGRTKQRGRALCAICFFKLPNDIKTSLYKPLGEGFEEAYEEALSFLS